MSEEVKGEYERNMHRNMTKNASLYVLIEMK